MRERVLLFVVCFFVSFFLHLFKLFLFVFIFVFWGVVEEIGKLKTRKSRTVGQSERGLRNDLFMNRMILLTECFKSH